MTLALKSPVRRETSTLYRRKVVLVEVTAHAAVLRLKYSQDRVIVPWETILDLGYKLRARAARAEKKALAKRNK